MTPPSSENEQPVVSRPKNLDGLWEEGPVDEHGYRHFRAGPVDVRGFEGFEPDGELVTHEPVNVHIERMDDGHWWIGLSWGEEMVAIDLHSKKPISVIWRDETNASIQDFLGGEAFKALRRQYMANR